MEMNNKSFKQIPNTSIGTARIRDLNILCDAFSGKVQHFDHCVERFVSRYVDGSK
jgi:hypothetical protein